MDPTSVCNLDGVRIVDMKLKNTALLMIFWLFCQQAGAVISSVVLVSSDNGSFQNEFSVEHPAVVSCHDNSAVELASDVSLKVGAHHHSETAQTNGALMEHDQQCCDIDCRCGVGGCLSMLGSESNQTTLALSFHQNDSYGSVFPQSLVRSLFRPPIVH